jgi:hypothetical protein
MGSARRTARGRRSITAMESPGRQPRSSRTRVGRSSPHECKSASLPAEAERPPRPPRAPRHRLRRSHRRHQRHARSPPPGNALGAGLDVRPNRGPWVGDVTAAATTPHHRSPAAPALSALVMAGRLRPVLLTIWLIVVHLLRVMVPRSTGGSPDGRTVNPPGGTSPPIVRAGFPSPSRPSASSARRA